MTAAATAQQCSGPQNCRAINKSTAEPKRLGSGTSPVNNPIPGRSRAERWVPVAPYAVNRFEEVIVSIEFVLLKLW
jgi:hypothetical protein